MARIIRHLAEEVDITLGLMGLRSVGELKKLGPAALRRVRGSKHPGVASEDECLRDNFLQRAQPIPSRGRGSRQPGEDEHGNVAT